MKAKDRNVESIAMANEKGGLLCNAQLQREQRQQPTCCTGSKVHLPLTPDSHLLILS